MTPRQIDLVRKSFAHVEPHRVALGESVYEHIFAAAPGARALFRMEIREHAVNLMSAIAMVVQALHQLETVVPKVRALGRRHAAYGVTKQHMELGGRALLLALADYAGPLDPEVEAAWSHAYAILAGVMLEGAAAAAPAALGPATSTRSSIS